MDTKELEQPSPKKTIADGPVVSPFNDATMTHDYGVLNFALSPSSSPSAGALATQRSKIFPVINFTQLANTPGTQQRAEAFLTLDPIDRTFKINLEIPEEESVSPTQTMSSAQKSMNKSVGKSAPMFALDDVDSLLSSRSGKKDTPRPSHVTEPKPATTRAKSVASKMKKPSEPEEH